MFVVNDDLSIYATRGDIVCLNVSATDDSTGNAYEFQPGDIVRMKIFAKKDAENVVMQKDFPVVAKTFAVGVFLTEDDTKIGEVISKPTDYWYEIELNPYTNPQTIVGYDEDGAKIFKLFPEGKDLHTDEPTKPEDIPVVDKDLSLTSSRPVENKAIARAITLLQNDLLATNERLTAKISATKSASNDKAKGLSEEVAVERARIDNLTANPASDNTEITDGRISHGGGTWSNIGNNIRANGRMGELLAKSVDFVLEKKETTIINGWVDTEGEYKSNASTGDTHKCVQIDVVPGEQYLVYSEYGWGMPDAVAQMADGTPVQIYHTSTESRETNDFDQIITIPDKAAKLTVNCMSNNAKPMTVAKIAGCRSKVTEEYVANAVASAKSGASVYGDNMITAVKTSYGLKFGAEFVVESGDKQFSVGECEVEQGKTYYIKSGASFMSNPYLFFDSAGVLVGDMIVAPASGYQQYDMEVVAPPGAVLMKVGQYGGVWPEVYEVTGHSEQKWKGLKWVCVGDSLTEENERTTKHYFDYIAEKTGISVVNMGVGGTGYKRGDDRSLAIYQRIEDVPEDADIVTIFGSGNDVSILSVLGKVTDTGTDTICGCMNTTIQKLYNINPTMQIGIISPTPWIHHQPSDNSGMAVYVRAMKEVCELNGVPFLDLFHASGFRPNEEEYRNLVFSKDDGNGVHPNEKGHEIIAKRIKPFLENFIL